jgi:hypothetical protein
VRPVGQPSFQRQLYDLRAPNLLAYGSTTQLALPELGEPYPLPRQGAKYPAGCPDPRSVMVSPRSAVRSG